VRWPERRRRVSGLLLTGGAALLVVSGYALYYTIDAGHEVAALIHEVLGVGALALALGHWWPRHARRAQRKLRLTNQKVPRPTSPADTTSVTSGRGSESRSRTNTATTASSAKTSVS